MSDIPKENLHIDSSIIEKIATLESAANSIKMHQNTHHLIVPESYKHIDITKIVENAKLSPNRKLGTVKLSDIDSFVTFAKDMAQSETAYIYADPEEMTLTAIFNDNKSTPGFRDFRATYHAELSRELTIWINNNKQLKTQEEFAIFIEDNIADITEPSGEELLKIALTLQSTTEATFSSSRRLDNGQVQLSYTETIDTRAGNGVIEIPREFRIGVRLFKNGAAYRLRCRLKYRLNSGNIKFWYELDRPENAIDEAFIEYANKAGESGYTVLIGKA